MEKKFAVSVEQDVDLRPYNTFGMSVKARHFIRFRSEEELPDILRYIMSYPGKVLFVGGGSNMLFTEDWDGLVIKVETNGIEVLEEDEDFVYVRAEAGVVWDNLVNFCIEKGYGGLENLSLIPGTVGSSPIQNIGAYGVEMKDTFYMLEAVSIRTGEFREFYRNECQFDYRYSVFKGVYKGIYLILSVIFKLKKTPVLNLTYAAIEEEMALINAPHDIKGVSQAVINIRKSKLPDPAVTGNAGSFFKNPVLTAKQFTEFIAKHPEARYYETEEGYKIAAGWLIECCGWKGYREGDAGVHPKQALVLVNYGKATGRDIKQLSQKIADSVFEKFELTLEAEVNIL
ncbi:MAG TPA: UDP-N-acetylmuramate dehydrogenase [Lentimicrobium sp.]|nr:UDP-N-acetylmuramate dehydrogenase [Lentimicrobium sp.]